MQAEKRSRRGRPRRLSSPLNSILETGALYPGESELAFSEFRKLVATSLGTQDDFIDRLLINDIIDHAWEAIRLRKLKSAYLLRHILDKILETLTGTAVELDEAVALLEIRADGKFARFADIERYLVESGVTYAAIEAEVVMAKMAALQDYDRMIATAEERRDYHLRELERRHGVRRSRAREEIVELADGEFSTIGTEAAR